MDSKQVLFIYLICNIILVASASSPQSERGSASAAAAAASSSDHGTGDTAAAAAAAETSPDSNDSPPVSVTTESTRLSGPLDSLGHEQPENTPYWTSTQEPYPTYETTAPSVTFPSLTNDRVSEPSVPWNAPEGKPYDLSSGFTNPPSARPAEGQPGFSSAAAAASSISDLHEDSKPKPATTPRPSEVKPPAIEVPSPSIGHPLPYNPFSGNVPKGATLVVPAPPIMTPYVPKPIYPPFTSFPSIMSAVETAEEFFSPHHGYNAFNPPTPIQTPGDSYSNNAPSYQAIKSPFIGGSSRYLHNGNTPAARYRSATLPPLLSYPPQKQAGTSSAAAAAASSSDIPEVIVSNPSAPWNQFKGNPHKPNVPSVYQNPALTRSAPSHLGTSSAAASASSSSDLPTGYLPKPSTPWNAPVKKPNILPPGYSNPPPAIPAQDQPGSSSAASASSSSHLLKGYVPKPLTPRNAPVKKPNILLPDYSNPPPAIPAQDQPGSSSAASASSSSDLLKGYLPKPSTSWNAPVKKPNILPLGYSNPPPAIPAQDQPGSSSAASASSSSDLLKGYVPKPSTPWNAPVKKPNILPSGHSNLPSAIPAQSQPGSSSAAASALSSSDQLKGNLPKPSTPWKAPVEKPHNQPSGYYDPPPENPTQSHPGSSSAAASASSSSDSLKGYVPKPSTPWNAPVKKPQFLPPHAIPTQSHPGSSSAAASASSSSDSLKGYVPKPSTPWNPPVKKPNNLLSSYYNPPPAIPTQSHIESSSAAASASSSSDSLKGSVLQPSVPWNVPVGKQHNLSSGYPNPLPAHPAQSLPEPSSAAASASSSSDSQKGVVSKPSALRNKPVGKPHILSLGYPNPPPAIPAQDQPGTSSAAASASSSSDTPKGVVSKPSALWNKPEGKPHILSLGYPNPPPAIPAQNQPGTSSAAASASSSFDTPKGNEKPAIKPHYVPPAYRPPTPSRPPNQPGFPSDVSSTSNLPNAVATKTPVSVSSPTLLQKTSAAAAASSSSELPIVPIHKQSSPPDEFDPSTSPTIPLKTTKTGKRCRVRNPKPHKI